MSNNVKKFINRMFLILVTAFIFSLVIDVQAIDVSTAAELKAALESGGDVKLAANITTSERIDVTKDGSLDLAGKVISFSANSGFLYITGSTDNRVNFEVFDSETGGKIIYEATSNANLNIFTLLYANLEFKSGTAESNRSIIFTKANSRATISGGVLKAKWYAAAGNGTTDPNQANYGNNAEIIVTGGELISDEDYVIYMPAKDGKLSISGGTMITEGLAGAIAINRGNVVISGGTLISGGVDVDAGFTHDGTNSFKAAVINVAAKYGDVTLEITDGNFIAPEGSSIFASGSYNITTYDGTADISIKGGHFSDIPEIDAADGYKIFYNFKDETYDVSSQYELKLDSDVIVLTVDGVSGKIHNGKPELVGLAFDETAYDELTEEQANYYSDMVEIDYTTGKITANKTGTGIFKIWTGVGDDVQEKNLTVVVIPKPVVHSLADEIDEDKVITDNDASSLNAELGAALLNVVTTDDEELDELGLAVKNAVLEGKVISAQIITDTVEKDDVDDDIQNEVEKKLKDDSKVVGYYDIKIEILVDGDNVGTLDELENEVDITLPIPDGLPEVPKGKVRIFAIIRVHGDENETSELKATDNGDGTITFSSDKYSTFVLTYTDVDQTPIDDTPNTGTIATLGIILMLVSGGALVVVRSRKYLK